VFYEVNLIDKERVIMMLARPADPFSRPYFLFPVPDGRIK